MKGFFGVMAGCLGMGVLIWTVVWTVALFANESRNLPGGLLGAMAIGWTPIVLVLLFVKLAQAKERRQKQ